MAVSHHGDARATLRGQRAVEFFGEVEAVGEQGLLARRTGHYRRGNERPPPNHPSQHEPLIGQTDDLDSLLDLG